MQSSRFCVRCDATPRPPRSISRSQRLRQQGTSKLTPEQRIEQQRQLQREMVEIESKKAQKSSASVTSNNNITAPEAEQPPLNASTATTTTTTNTIDITDNTSTYTSKPSSQQQQQIQSNSNTVVDAEVVSSSPSYNRQISQEEEQIKDEILQKSRILMQIMQAGATVESVITQYQNEIDETMLELLQRRIDAARRLERQPEVLEGLTLLYKRLKSEVDRNKASPAMKLLDSVLKIINDDGNGNDTNANNKGIKKSFGLMEDSIRSQVVAKIKAAFGSAPLQTDVLSLAAQLASGGEAVVDALMDDQVDSTQFIDEVKALLDGAMEQQKQLKDILDRLPEKGAERDKVQMIINDREEALEQVQEVLSIAISVKREI